MLEAKQEIYCINIYEARQLRIQYSSLTHIDINHDSWVVSSNFTLVSRCAKYLSTPEWWPNRYLPRHLHSYISSSPKCFSWNMIMPPWVMFKLQFAVHTYWHLDPHHGIALQIFSIKSPFLTTGSRCICNFQIYVVTFERISSVQNSWEYLSTL